MINDSSILSTFSGAVVRRTVDQSHAVVPEHAHDWHVLSVFISGSYHNRTELGEAALARPSGILYRPGAAHANQIGQFGFEQIEIEFDPGWLGNFTLPDLPVSRWTGGRMATLSRNLARRCSEQEAEHRLKSALLAFFEEANRAATPIQPRWLDRLQLELESSPSISVRQLAERLSLHPFWVGQAYRNATGETLQQAKSRLQVQRASMLLRETDGDAASIALDAGFYDQSHMIRMFRRVLGRKPSDVRTDSFRQFPARGAPGATIP